MRILLLLVVLGLSSIALAQDSWAASKEYLQKLNNEPEPAYGYTIRLPNYTTLIDRDGGMMSTTSDSKGKLFLKSISKSVSANAARAEILAKLKSDFGNVESQAPVQGRINGIPFLRTSFTFRCPRKAHPFHFGDIYVYNGTRRSERLVMTTYMFKGISDPEWLRASVLTLKTAES